MKQSIAITLALFSFLFFPKNEILAQSKAPDFKDSFSSVEEIDINIGSGDLEITPSSSGKVEVKGFYDEDEVRVKVEKSGDKLRIVEKNRHDSNHSSSRWYLKVPADMELEANLGTGDVMVEGFSGELEGNCGTGDLDLKDGKGEVTWNSGTGDFDLSNFSGECSLNSGTGSVELENVSGEMSLNSGTGKVKLVDCSGEIGANSGTGRVTATNVKITDHSSFNSGTGDVYVSLGAPTDSDLSVNSGTGNAELDFNGQNFDGTLTMVCNKKSGHIKAPFEFDEEWTEGDSDNPRRQTLYKQKKFGGKDIEVKVGTGTGTAAVLK